MNPKKENSIPESKLKSVRELTELIKNKKTILIASIKNIPASQFQKIGKKLRSKAIIKVPKKNLIVRALDSSETEAIKKLKEQIKDNITILFSDMDCFDLASELIKNKSPAKARAGQESPEDIEVPAGPTDLVPGPAISELGALGIKIQIQGGKIHIKEPKMIVKKGEKISVNAAGIMNKLDIKPFSIGLTPLCAFDTQEGKLYLEIKIDKEAISERLKVSFGKAFAFAVEINYICEDTIEFLIRKAGTDGRVLEKIAEAGALEDETDNKENNVDKENNVEQKSNKQTNRKSDLTNKENSKPQGEANLQEETKFKEGDK
ncbi:hypothetical protein ES703_68875 [subsurface metagenome]